jgi:F-type H+-transporting ATPase subunit b
MEVLKQLGLVLKQLGLDGRTLLVNAAGFIILVLLLKRFLFAPVAKILKQREERVADTLAKADSDRQAMEKIRTEYEGRIAQIEQEARNRIQEAIKEAGTIRSQLLEEARRQSQEILERGQAEIEREKQKAIVALRDEVVDLAVEAAEKLLRERLDDAAHRRLVSDFIEGMENYPWKT